MAGYLFETKVVQRASLFSYVCVCVRLDHIFLSGTAPELTHVTAILCTRIMKDIPLMHLLPKTRKLISFFDVNSDIHFQQLQQFCNLAKVGCDKFSTGANFLNNFDHLNCRQVSKYNQTQDLDKHVGLYTCMQTPVS